ncbi:hypothetical protein RE476_09210 [Methanolobus mangrovi]|uniref:Uncharacterized protein n=1 Tax=Methanolobus mangrovi TaxID=3072977 RepID=A0AA51UE95_9EURY|nr:hypothetical protein [Methanolobus mangrovi]WMW21565.1 hypothetical protein RE476_09210 [Methanolobus mangrovi]
MGNDEANMNRIKEVTEFVKASKKEKKEEKNMDKKNILGLND